MKYYCGMCETSHHEMRNGATCPSCGRKYCLDSIKECIYAGKNECPYCDIPFNEFPLKGKLLKLIALKTTSAEEEELPEKIVLNKKPSYLFQLLLQFLESNKGAVFNSPRENLSRGKRKPMKFGLIEINNSDQYVKIQFHKLDQTKTSLDTKLPLEYWRFELAINYLVGKEFVPIGARLTNPPEGSLECILQEEDRRLYHRETATKTAPHIADLLVLAGIAEFDKVKSPISGRRVQAIKLKENTEKNIFYSKSKSS